MARIWVKTVREEARARDRILARMERDQRLEVIGPAPMLEQCNGCGDWFSIWHVEWDGQRMVCAGCQQEVKNYIAHNC